MDKMIRIKIEDVCTLSIALMILVQLIVFFSSVITLLPVLAILIISMSLPLWYKKDMIMIELIVNSNKLGKEN